MFRAIQFMLVAVVLFGTCAVAQAESLPLLKNVTTGVAILQDGFESGTVGSPPALSDPTVGEWVRYLPATSGHVWVTNEATSGVAAYEGSKYLDVYRGTDIAALWGAGTASEANDTVMFQAAFYGSTHTGSQATIYFQDTTTATDVGGFAVASGGAFTFRTPYGTSPAYQNITQTWTAGQWNTLVITHTNYTADWTISINGQTPETVTSFVEGETHVVSGLQFCSAAINGGAYWDAIPVPEPSSLALLATGLIGLLCYAWRRRK